MNDAKKELKIEALNAEINFIKRQIEITEGYSKNDGNLSFLYHQLKALTIELQELNEVDENEIHKRNGR